MSESKGFYDRQNAMLSETLHDDLVHKRQIYRQMAMLIHDLQGTDSECPFANDEDDSICDVIHLSNRKNTSLSSLRHAMSEAIARKDSKLLRRLLSMFDKMSYRSQGHAVAKMSLSSAMAEAIDSKNVEMVGILLEGKASPSDSHKGQCHLARAIKTGNYDIVKRLVEAGADVNADVDSKTILHIAASVSSADVIQCLLANGSCIEATDHIQGNTALHIACSYCNAEAVRVLIQHGAEFNCRNFQGDSPLAKLLRHITKNKQDWYNSKSLKLAKVLIETGLMIFPNDNKYATANDKKHYRKSRENHHDLAFTLPTLSSNFPTFSNTSSSIHMCSDKHFKTHTSDKYSTSSPHEKFLSLVHSLEEFDEDSENREEFPILSSSSSSSSLSSSSSSSLSSCESSFSLAEEHEIMCSTSSPETQRSCPWWKKKESKMCQLYDKILSQSRASWSLQQHCRLVVLRCLGTQPLKSCVNTLCLPQMVQRYIIYGHLASLDMNT